MNAIGTAGRPRDYRAERGYSRYGGIQLHIKGKSERRMLCKHIKVTTSLPIAA